MKPSEAKKGTPLMSDERRQLVRRQEDLVSHAQLAAQVAEVRTEITEHVHPEVERIIDALEGPCVEHLDGRMSRDTDAGMIARQERMEHLLANGVKVKQSLATADWIKIVVALITTAGVIIGAT